MTEITRNQKPPVPPHPGKTAAVAAAMKTVKRVKREGRFIWVTRTHQQSEQIKDEFGLIGCSVVGGQNLRTLVGGGGKQLCQVEKVRKACWRIWPIIFSNLAQGREKQEKNLAFQWEFGEWFSGNLESFGFAGRGFASNSSPSQDSLSGNLNRNQS